MVILECITFRNVQIKGSFSIAAMLSGAFTRMCVPFNRRGIFVRYDFNKISILWFKEVTSSLKQGLIAMPNAWRNLKLITCNAERWEHSATYLITLLNETWAQLHYNWILA